MCGCVCMMRGVGYREDASDHRALLIYSPTTVQLLCCHRFLLAPNSLSVRLAVSSSRVLWPG